MARLKVVLAGAEWCGDILGACLRALRCLGAEVAVVVTNESSDSFLEAYRLERRLRRVPVLGRRLAETLLAGSRQRLLVGVRRDLEAALGRASPDVFLALVDGAYPLLPELLAKYKRVHKIAWLMDNPYLFRPGLVEWLSVFDEIAVVEGSIAMPLGLATARPVSTVALAADPFTFRPLTDEGCQAMEHELVFIGKSYRSSAAGVTRARLLASVSGLGLAIWGDKRWCEPSGSAPSFRSFYRGGPVGPEEANRIYNGSKIILNISHPQIRHGTSLRTFSICASGAFQIVDWRPGLDEMLEPGREVVTYRTADEFVDLCLRYRNDSKARNDVARAGLRRVLAEHTYVHRLAKVLDGACHLKGLRVSHAASERHVSGL